MKKALLIILLLPLLCHSQWTLDHYIQGENNNDDSGTTISMNAAGDIIAIGEPKNAENGANSGQVRVYQKIAGTWQKIGSDINGENVNDSVWGITVSLNANGDVLAVGTAGNDDGATAAGKIRVYQYSMGDWVQIGADIIGANNYDLLGNSIS